VRPRLSKVTRPRHLATPTVLRRINLQLRGGNPQAEAEQRILASASFRTKSISAQAEAEGQTSASTSCRSCRTEMHQFPLRPRPRDRPRRRHHAAHTIPRCINFRLRLVSASDLHNHTIVYRIVNPRLLNNDSESMADLREIAVTTLFVLGPGIKEPG
jgi:hypothetical protein